MKAIGKIWNGTSLIVKILIGLVLGALLGLLVPQASFLTILGDLFVGALKGIAPLLVFVLVISIAFRGYYTMNRRGLSIKK